MARHREFDEDEVLQRAMELFWQQGYEATSVRDLLTHLAISSSSLYETYGDKHALYLACLAYFRQRELGLMLAQLTEFASAHEVLRHWFAELIDNLLADEHFGGSFAVNAAIELGTTDEAVAEQLRQHFADVTAVLTTFLTEAQARGDIPPSLEALALAQFFVSTLFGMCTLVKVVPNRQVLENIAASALAVLD